MSSGSGVRTVTHMLRSYSRTTEVAPPARPGTPDVATLGEVLAPTRAVLTAFAALTLLATNQLIVLADHTDRFFAWTILVNRIRRSWAPRTPPGSCCRYSP